MGRSKEGEHAGTGRTLKMFVEIRLKKKSLKSHSKEFVVAKGQKEGSYEEERERKVRSMRH